MTLMLPAPVLVRWCPQRVDPRLSLPRWAVPSATRIPTAFALSAVLVLLQQPLRLPRRVQVLEFRAVPTPAQVQWWQYRSLDLPPQWSGTYAVHPVRE